VAACCEDGNEHSGFVKRREVCEKVVSQGVFCFIHLTRPNREEGARLDIYDEWEREKCTQTP
jgi:hypothetical protein